MKPGYQIIHQPEFDKELAALQGNLAEGDEFVQGVTWLLSRDPTRGGQLNEWVWYVPYGGPDNARVLVYYTFSRQKKEVYLLSIRKAAARSAG